MILATCTFNRDPRNQIRLQERQCNTQSRSLETLPVFVTLLYSVRIVTMVSFNQHSRVLSY